MNSSTNNPITNSLKSGITDNDIDNAIRKSGYPLQTVIANQLRLDFMCQEEWSYIDRKTKEIRSIDIMAEDLVYDLKKPEPKVRPILNLIIECKQSELPYVFFLSPDKLKTSNYPYITGLFKQMITLSTNDDTSTWTFPIIDVLGLSNENYIINSAPCSMTFSKCVRSGRDITLSGTESYQNLVLPLITSLLYFNESKTPPKTALYFDGHLPFAIGVLDAPMIGVHVYGDTHVSKLIPWVRVFRHESYESENWTERTKIYAIDIVHKDFFDEFIKTHLMPFVQKFADLIIKHDKKIALGKAFVKGLGKDSWTNIEGRLENLPIIKRNFIK